MGITAIWLTPVVEQIHGGHRRRHRHTYAYHGYWAKDWTALDPKLRHGAGIGRVCGDGSCARHPGAARRGHNHTGPVTPQDPGLPRWLVRLDPVCNFKDDADYH
jgi:alpha-amylase